MFKVATASAAVVLAAVMFACSGGTGTVGGGGGSTTPVENGHVTSSAGMNVDATISAATLGDECGGGGQAESKFAPADCAPIDGGSCGGGSFCQQSNVQIAFTSGDGSAPAKIQIVSVTLHDANDGSQIDELDASNPQKWNTSGGYQAWDQSIAPKTELKASYSLSAPAWSTMSDQSFSRKFRLRVTVTIDGSTVVLQSTILSREPAVAT